MHSKGATRVSASEAEEYDPFGCPNFKECWDWEAQANLEENTAVQMVSGEPDLNKVNYHFMPYILGGVEVEWPAAAAPTVGGKTIKPIGAERALIRTDRDAWYKEIAKYPKISKAVLDEKLEKQDRVSKQ